MLRILIVAAVATLFAAPASAQSTRVSMVGKTPAELTADINKAAKKVCTLAVMGSSFQRERYARCYKATVADAVARAGDRALAVATEPELAQR